MWVVNRGGCYNYGMPELGSPVDKRPFQLLAAPLPGSYYCVHNSRGMDVLLVINKQFIEGQDVA